MSPSSWLLCKDKIIFDNQQDIGRNYLEFRGNSEITEFDEFELFTGVTVISGATFRESTALQSIIFPNNLEKIDSNTFDGFIELSIEDLNLKCLSLLGNSSFRGTKIKKISNLGKITDSGIGVFSNCKDLTEATFPDAITIIKNGYFLNCIKLNKVVMPASLKEIWDSAFEGCANLQSIILPDSIILLGNGVFRDCVSMRSITILATTPPQLGPYNVFTNTNNCPIYVPAASVDAYKSAPSWSNYASRIQPIID